MDPLLVYVFAQQTPLDPSLWNQFGPFSIVFIVMTTLGGGIILWLIRDRARVIAQRDTLFQQVVESEKRTTETVAHMGPILEAVAQELRLAREKAR